MKKKILIAVNNKLDKKLQEDIEKIPINIQYKEGILEVLELNKNIDYILLSEELIGQITITNLLNEILKINSKIIIYILTKRKRAFIKENREILKRKNIKIVNDINDEKLSSIFILEAKEDVNINIKNNLEKLDNKSYTNIISILGTNGVGKSITTLKIAKYLEKNKKKILLIDLDNLNKSLKLILGVKEKNNIIKVNKNIDLIENDGKIDIIKYIKEQTQNYDYILVDTSSEIFFELTENILKISDNNIFLVEPNLLGIKKANTLLNIYTEKWNINKEKIKILFNKYNKYSIKYGIVKKVFPKFKIIGRIKINEKYDLVVNRNNLKYLLIKNKRQIYKRTIKDISKRINKIKGEKVLWN